MQTRQWHLFLVLVVGLPLKLHSSQGLFFPKTAILMLRERFLIAENACEKIFPRFARTDRRFAPLRYEWAIPLLLCRCRPCTVGPFVHGLAWLPVWLHLSAFLVRWNSASRQAEADMHMHEHAGNITILSQRNTNTTSGNIFLVSLYCIAMAM